MSKIKLFYLALLLPLFLSLSACVETTQFQVDRYQMDDLRDDDSDGIINQRDLCTETPELVAIDSHGCAFWEPVNNINWFAVEFEYDRSNIRDSELPVLKKAFVHLTENPKTKLVLIGDTSSEGSLAYNEALAKRRHNSVKDYLVSRGIDINRIEMQIFDQPTPFTQYIQSRQRRTIAVFMDQKQVLTKEWNIYTTEEEK